MSQTKRLQLWENNNEETHGGENNGSSRRVFCPASAKYADMQGLGDWVNRRAFGFFHSGNGADPARGGGTAGQINTVDYITGMPDMRTEHVHAIDVDGYDKLRIEWSAECLDYEGLAIDWANVPSNTPLTFWADSVFACAFGAHVIEEGLDYVNFAPGLWANANDPLSGEGVGSNLASLQSLNDNDVDNTPTTRWTVTGGFAISGGAAVYTHAGGGGTLTQTSANFAAAVLASHRYRVQYQVTANTLTGSPTMELSGVSASAVTLPRTVGTHFIEFTSHATPGNFVITVAASASGGITLDNIYLTLDLTPGSLRRPRPMFTAPNNGVYNEPAMIAVAGALAMRGQSFIFGADSPTRYSRMAAPRGLPDVVGAGQVAWGALQYGWTQRLSDGTCYGKLPRGGDRYKVVIEVGHPQFSTTASTQPSVNDSQPVELNITGLERVYFSLASIGVAFAPTGPGLTPEYLISQPVGPATAPRQHIKGRLYAILSKA